MNAEQLAAYQNSGDSVIWTLIAAALVATLACIIIDAIIKHLSGD